MLMNLRSNHVNSLMSVIWKAVWNPIAPPIRAVQQLAQFTSFRAGHPCVENPPIISTMVVAFVVSGFQRVENVDDSLGFL